MSRLALSPFKNWKSENQLFKWSQIHLKPSVIDKKFIPSLDENGIIYAHGLLEDVRLWPQEMRNPVILPRVQLLLRHLHEKCGHCGYENLIHKARRNNWIIGVHNMSKALTVKCATCMQKTSQETAGPANGADPILTSGSRFSILFQHHHGHLRTLVSSNVLQHDNNGNKGCSPRPC